MDKAAMDEGAMANGAMGKAATNFMGSTDAPKASGAR